MSQMNAAFGMESLNGRQRRSPFATSSVRVGRREVMSLCRIVVERLFDTVDNVKGFILDDAILSRFDLRREYGIDPSPLFNLNDSADFSHCLTRACGSVEFVLAEHWSRLLQALGQIQSKRLFGRETGAKLAFLRDVTGYSFTKLTSLRPVSMHDLASCFLKVAEKLLTLLDRHQTRLRLGDKMTEVRNISEAVRASRMYFQLRALSWNHPKCSEDASWFCNVFSDEIAQIAGEYFCAAKGGKSNVASRLRFIRGKGIEVAYARRDRSFLKLGDRFGDCTASKVRTQSESHTANIHWTVYPWLLNPYYQIVNVHCDGEEVMKGHVLPMVIQGTPLLMLDAIEVVPKLRKDVRGIANPFISTPLYLKRHDLLAALIKLVTQLADRMGLETIYVDKFSNASWIRIELDRLARNYYHVDDAAIPFGVDPILAVMKSINKSYHSDVHQEVQAVNLAFWDQGLRNGFKEVAVLRGERRRSKAPLRSP